MIQILDHREPTKKSFTIALVARQRPWCYAAAEIEKCDLVCANCHAQRTWNRRQEAKLNAGIG